MITMVGVSEYGVGKTGKVPMLDYFGLYSWSLA